MAVATDDGGDVMTPLAILAWSVIAVVALIVLLFVALCIRLIPAVLQERALSRLEAEQVDAELRQPDGPLAPLVPEQWRRFGDEDLSDPNLRSMPPNNPAS